MMFCSRAGDVSVRERSRSFRRRSRTYVQYAADACRGIPGSRSTYLPLPSPSPTPPSSCLSFTPPSLLSRYRERERGGWVFCRRSRCAGGRQILWNYGKSAVERGAGLRLGTASWIFFVLRVNKQARKQASGQVGRQGKEQAMRNRASMNALSGAPEEYTLLELEVRTIFGVCGSRVETLRYALFVCISTLCFILSCSLRVTLQRASSFLFRRQVTGHELFRVKLTPRARKVIFGRRDRSSPWFMKRQCERRVVQKNKK